MKKTIFTLGFALGTTLSFFAYSNSVSAQVTNSQGNATGGKYQSNEQSATSGSTFGSDFNPLDLIHNANMRRSRDSGQFQEDTNTGLNQAADEFKRKQQQMMQSQPSNTVPDATSEK